MKRTYDSELNQIVTDVNAGMSNAVAFDKQQQDELVAIKASLSNTRVAVDSNLAAYKSSMTQSIDTQTFNASTIYAANGIIVGPSNNSAITYSNSGLVVPMALNVNGAAFIGGSSNSLLESSGAPGSKYGIAAPASGQVKFYGPSSVSGASVSMGFARADGTYEDALTAVKTATGFSTTLKGPATIGNIIIDGTSGVTSSSNFNLAATKVSLTANNGVAVPIGDLVMQSGKLCIQTSCLDKATLDKVIAAVNAPATTTTTAIAPTTTTTAIAPTTTTTAIAPTTTTTGSRTTI